MGTGFWQAKLIDKRTGRLERRDLYGHDESQYWNLVKELQLAGWDVQSLKYKSSGLFKFRWAATNVQLDLLTALRRSMRAGAQAGSALYALIEGQSRRALRLRLEPAREVIRQTGSVAAGFRVTGLLSAPILSIIEAGETSGGIDAAVDAAVKFLESQKSALKRFKWVFGLIIAEIFTSMSTMLYIALNGKDMLSEILGKANLASSAELLSKLDASTMANTVLLGVSAPLLFAAGVLLLGYQLSDKKGRAQLDPFVSKLPVFRSLIQDSAFSVSFGIAARVLKAGGTAVKALEVAAESSTVPAVQKYFRGVLQELESGLSLQRAVVSPQLFPSELVSVGTFSTSQQLGEVFEAFSEGRQEHFGRNLMTLASHMTAFMLFSGAIAGWWAVDAWSIGSQAMEGVMDQAGGGW